MELSDVEQVLWWPVFKLPLPKVPETFLFNDELYLSPALKFKRFSTIRYLTILLHVYFCRCCLNIVYQHFPWSICYASFPAPQIHRDFAALPAEKDNNPHRFRTFGGFCELDFKSWCFFRKSWLPVDDFIDALSWKWCEYLACQKSTKDLVESSTPEHLGGCVLLGILDMFRSFSQQKPGQFFRQVVMPISFFCQALEVSFKLKEPSRRNHMVSTFEPKNKLHRSSSIRIECYIVLIWTSTPCSTTSQHQQQTVFCGMALQPLKTTKLLSESVVLIACHFSSILLRQAISKNCLTIVQTNFCSLDGWFHRDWNPPNMGV